MPDQQSTEMNPFKSVESFNTFEKMELKKSPTDTSPETAALPKDPDKFENIERTLREILLELKQQNRLNIQQDFSYSRLLGAVCQLLVIGLLFWTTVGLADLGEISGPGGTTIKLLGSILLPIIALTFFFLDHQQK